MEKGDSYHRLTAVEYVGKNQSNKKLWKFDCSCGNQLITVASYVKTGRTKSCGCYKKDVLLKRNTKHNFKKSGDKPTRTYNSWIAMKARCLNKNSTKYKDYGGRGISICTEWLDSFENFLRDMGEAPKGMTLDRVDNTKGYCIENCRWANARDQSTNRRARRNNKTKVNGVYLDKLSNKYVANATDPSGKRHSLGFSIEVLGERSALEWATKYRKHLEDIFGYSLINNDD